MSHWSKKSWENTNVYVQNLGKDINEAKLCQLFAAYGTITSSKIPNDENGASKGFGFVNFERSEMAQRAIDQLNGFVLESGQRLYVRPFQTKFERQTELQQTHQETIKNRSNGLCLYLSNLDSTVDEEQLETIFSKFGRITKTHIMRNGDQSKGVGFVCFGSVEDATRALSEMNGQRIVSKPIYVKLSEGNEDSQPMAMQSSTPSPAATAIDSPPPVMHPLYPRLTSIPTMVFAPPSNGHPPTQPTARSSPSPARFITSQAKYQPYPYVLVKSDDQHED